MQILWNSQSGLKVVTGWIWTQLQHFLYDGAKLCCDISERRWSSQIMQSAQLLRQGQPPLPSLIAIIGTSEHLVWDPRSSTHKHSLELKKKFCGRRVFLGLHPHKACRMLFFLQWQKLCFEGHHRSVQPEGLTTATYDQSRSIRLRRAWLEEPFRGHRWLQSGQQGSTNLW